MTHSKQMPAPRQPRPQVPAITIAEFPTRHDGATTADALTLAVKALADRTREGDTFASLVCLPRRTGGVSCTVRTRRRVEVIQP